MKKEKGIALITLLLIIAFIGIAIISIAFFVIEKNENNTTIAENKEKNKTVTEQTAPQKEETETQAKKEHFILYEGVEIPTEPKIINVYDKAVKLDKTYESRYNTTFYNYEKGKYLGESTGKFTYKNSDYQFVENVEKIAISDKYDAIPRQATKIDEIPPQLMDMMDYSRLDIESIDLDGDGTQEYIIVAGVDYTEGQIGDGEPESASTVMLLNSSFEKVADLVNLADGFTSPDRTEDSRVFIAIDDVIYVDIDNDGIMEIIVKVPTYEGLNISIFKYNKGNLQGEANYEAVVRP